MADGRVVLVTGASSGFGKVVASLLVERGFRVFGTSRQPGRAREDGFEMLPLDVDSDRSVDACISSVMETAGKVDVLVNNAGYGLTGGVEEVSLAEAKAQFETNFFGVVRTTKAVLPSMRQRKSGQIINMGSIAGTVPVPFEGFYAATKAALFAYSEALRHEVKGFNIKVSVVQPGFFRTNFGNARKMAIETIEAYDGMRRRTLSRLERHLEEGADPKIVAGAVLRIIESPSPRLKYAVGRERRYLLLKKITPASRFESALRAHWQLEE